MIQQRVREGTLDWETVTEDLRQLGEKLLGKTSGNMKQGKETWWQRRLVRVDRVNKVRWAPE